MDTARAQGRKLPFIFCIFCITFVVASLFTFRNSLLLVRSKPTSFAAEVIISHTETTHPTMPPVKVPSSVFIDDFFIPRNATKSGITTIIHQSWKTSTLPSQRMKRWADSWKRCYPKWTYKLWTDHDNLNFIKKYYPWFVKRYESFPQNIMRVDAVRYFYMLHYGGIYADLDTECVRPFEHLLNASIVLGAMDGHWVDNSDIGHIQNSFMYSRPGNSYWLENIMGILNRDKLGGVEDSTGPLLMMRLLSKYKARGIKNVMVYPGKYFNPFSWISNPNPRYCKVQGSMTENDLSMCRNALNDSYVIQYHTKTWAGGKA